MKPTILIVDDEPGVRTALTGVLHDEGYAVEAVSSGEACLDRLTRGPVDLIVLDVWLPGLDGLATFARLRERQVDAQVVLISGHGNIESAVRAIKMGAFDFVEKPLSLEKTVLVIRNALRQRRLEAENRALRARVLQNEFAQRENLYLRRMLHYLEGPRFPASYDPVNAEVIARPDSAFTQSIVIAAGASDGVRANDPVVTVDGLAGLVTRVSSHTALVELLTDQEAAASAIDVRTTPEAPVLDRVRKQDVVRVGDEIVTAGWRTGTLSSLYPKGIQIGTVTSVGQTDTDLYQQVQVDPSVDFGSLDAVIVLVPKGRTR